MLKKMLLITTIMVTTQNIVCTSSNSVDRELYAKFVQLKNHHETLSCSILSSTFLSLSALICLGTVIKNLELSFGDNVMNSYYSEYVVDTNLSGLNLTYFLIVMGTISSGIGCWAAYKASCTQQEIEKLAKLHNVSF